MSALRTIKSFVLRTGRITEGQKKAYEELYKKYGIELDNCPKPLDLSLIFPNYQKINLEIGFGNGESLVQMAKNFPEEAFLGVEVYPAGVGHLLIKIEEEGLKNLKIIKADGLYILQEFIAKESIDRGQVYFSDPWPKKRHHKRRLINQDFCNLFWEKLKPNGELHLATDWENYAENMLLIFKDDPKWQNLGNNDGFADKPSFRPLTKFEERGIKKGHQIWDLRYLKNRGE